MASCRATCSDSVQVDGTQRRKADVVVVGTQHSKGCLIGAAPPERGKAIGALVRVTLIDAIERTHGPLDQNAIARAASAV